MKLHYFGAFNRKFEEKAFSDVNFGDLAILSAEEKYLGKATKISTPANLQEIEEDEIFIIGGGGIIHPSPTLNNYLLNFNLEDIKAKKIIVMGVGKNFQNKDIWHDISRYHLENLLNKADYICGRDIETLQFLNFHSNKEVYFCPDAALFLIEKDFRNVSSKYFSVIYNKSIDISFIEDIAKKTKLEPVFILQNHIFIKDIENIPKQYKVIVPQNLNEFLLSLRYKNFCVSGTLHGIILNLSMNIPVISVNNAQRIKFFQDVFLYNYNDFSCIITEKEIDFLDKFVSYNHKNIIMRKLELKNIFLENINRIHKILQERR